MTTQAFPTVVPFDKRRGFGNDSVLSGSPSGDPDRHRLSFTTGASVRRAVGFLGPVYPVASATLGGIGEARALTLRRRGRRGCRRVPTNGKGARLGCFGQCPAEKRDPGPCPPRKRNVVQE